MIQRIKSIQAMPNYVLSVVFDDGRHVLYDVKEDMNLPGYNVLRDIAGLFQQVQLDKSRTCVYWNDDVDLPSDTIYEYGKEALTWANGKSFGKSCCNTRSFAICGKRLPPLLEKTKFSSEFKFPKSACPRVGMVFQYS